jgi:hypothetical protein
VKPETRYVHADSGVLWESQLMAVTYDLVLPFSGTRKALSSWASRRKRPMQVQPSAGVASRIHNWSRTMTFSRIALIAVAAFAMAPGVGPAFAADDDARIKECVADNQGEGQTAAVVAAYCACMSKKMSASETQSITTWENSHPNDQGNCSVEAGAKSTK